MLKKCAILLLAVCAGALSISYLMNRPEKNAKLENIEYPSPIVIRTAYEEGYWKGYGAFLSQSGFKLPPIKFAKYTFSDSEEEKGEVERGYVDGYHKATECVLCPRL